jgi:hypothetical protein
MTTLTAEPPGPFWLRGGEGGGVGLMCRLCDAGGAPVAYWLDPPAQPADVSIAAALHDINAHPPQPRTFSCDLDWPLDEDQVLGWAHQAQWHLQGYYKFAFTFVAALTIAMPDDPEAREATALATVSGDPGDFYRFQADADKPESWDSLRYVRTPDLSIRDDDDGTELMRINGG